MTYFGKSLSVVSTRGVRSPLSCCRIKRHVFIKLIVTISVGVAIGMLCVGLAIVTEALKVWKNATTRSIIHDGYPHGILRATVFHGSYSTALIILGSCIVRDFSFLPAGSQL